VGHSEDSPTSFFYRIFKTLVIVVTFEMVCSFKIILMVAVKKCLYWIIAPFTFEQDKQKYSHHLMC